MTRIREANKQYNIHITYLSPLLKFGKRKVFTVRKLVSCDVDKVRGITIFVRKKVGGIDSTHPPPRVRRLCLRINIRILHARTSLHPQIPILPYRRPNRTVCEKFNIDTATTPTFSSYDFRRKRTLTRQTVKLLRIQLSV